MTITIENEPYSVTRWTAGTYTDNFGIEYEFTIESRSDENTNQVMVNWCDNFPLGEGIEDQIINQYQNSKI